MIREKVLDVKDLGNRLGRNLCSEEEFNSDYGGQLLRFVSYYLRYINFLRSK